MFITFFKTVTLANLFSPAHLLSTQRYLIFSTQLTQLKGMDTMFKDTDELSSKDFLKFSQQQDTYLIIFIRVSRVIKVATPLKPTASKIFITSYHSLLILLTQGLFQGRETGKKVIRIFHYILSVPSYIKLDLVRGVKSCAHPNTHQKSILGVLLWHTVTISTHNYSAPRFWV